MYKTVAQTPAKDIGRLITKRCFAIADTHGKHLDLGKISGDWFFMSGTHILDIPDILSLYVVK